MRPEPQLPEPRKVEASEGHFELPEPHVSEPAPESEDAIPPVEPAAGGGLPAGQEDRRDAEERRVLPLESLEIEGTAGAVAEGYEKVMKLKDGPTESRLLDEA